ncbi:MAG: T9SS type A sorting domain-containing protein [Candidatus Marinimicrobia bacterium]|nr:T9SS type A sorting domain-containing protein [Candidatus Neomarinimicrobiota bacterium]
MSTSAAAYPQRAEHLLAYPNPFNAETHFLFSMDRAGNTVLEVYDVRGRKVKTLLDDFLLPGRYRIPFHAAGLPSGVYLCRLQNASVAPVTKKVLLLK